MQEDQEALMLRFDMMRHELINVVQAYHIQHELTMDAVKACEGLKDESAIECMGCLKRAKNAAIILDELNKRLVRLLIDFEDIASKRYGISEVK